jgi:transcriptional regulator GlxA family with amidase domain
MARVNVGIFIYPKVTMLDAYAPHQVFSFVEQFHAFLFAKTKEPLISDSGAILTPNHGFDDCPTIDILVVAGAADTLDTLRDRETIDFLRKVGQSATYVTSVCTGALLLAEAGLLQGHRASTHWGWKDCLACYPGVTVVDDRVTIDGNRITGGGITAGLDFAFTVIREVVGVDAAQALQLIFHYTPRPPFPAAGEPETAPEHVLKYVEPLLARIKSNGIVEYCRDSSQRFAHAAP